MATPTYDPKKTKELLSIVGAHAAQPNGEYVAALAEQLLGAEVEIRAALGAASQADSAAAKAVAELESAQQSIVRLRSGASGLPEAIEALKLIARSSRGAQKIAQEALAKIAGQQPAAATEAKP